MADVDKDKKSKRKLRGWQKVLIVIGVLVVINLILLGAGCLYQQRTTRADFEQFPAPGVLVDVGGYRLHLYCTGENLPNENTPGELTPTVLVEAGNGDFSLGWALVQPQVAQYTRICTYDRAGYGWSDPAPTPRDGQAMAEELHTLLVNAGEEGPFILIGHSLGGLIARLYTAAYPDEVVGMILVDSAHEEQTERLPAAYTRVVQQQESYTRTMAFMARFGILRLMGKSMGKSTMPPHLKKLPTDAQDIYLTLMSHPSYFAATLDELKALPTTNEQVSQLDGLGDLPLIVLTAENTIDIETLESMGLSDDLPLENIQTTWRTLQEELAALSDRSLNILIEGSGHAIQLDNPDVITGAVWLVMGEARKK